MAGSAAKYSSSLTSIRKKNISYRSLPSIKSNGFGQPDQAVANAKPYFSVEAGQQDLSGGSYFVFPYEGRNVILVGQCNEKYICRLGKHIIKCPVQTSRGEIVCKSCYDSHLKTDPNICPIDGGPQSQIFFDRYTERQINQIECLCCNRKNGCEWKGVLSELCNHEKGCVFQHETCQMCGNSNVIKCYQKKHSTEQCPKQKIKCTHCPRVECRLEIKAHELECAERPIRCKYNCGEHIKKQDLYDHILNCPQVFKKGICPYGIFGCKFNVSEGNESLHDHITSNSNKHASLLLGDYIILQDRCKYLEDAFEKEKDAHTKLSTTVTQLQTNIKELEKTVEKHQQTSKETLSLFSSCKETIENKLAEYSERNGTLFSANDNVKRLISMHDQLQRAISTKKICSCKFNHMEELDKLHKEIDKCSEDIGIIDANQAITSADLSDLDLKLQLLENTCYNGRTIWKIDNIRFRIQQAVNEKIIALHSAPYYTERFGYKFCVRIYLDGDGMGKNTHVSIFIVIMRSEFDELLQWPFEKRVTFRLLNSGLPSRSIKETFLTDKNSSSFQKPAREMNVAAGCPTIATREELMQGGFIVDDCLFIETTIT